MDGNRHERRGFALVELVLAGIVTLGVVALILVLAGDQRRLGRLGDDLGKLRRIGALTGQYGADHADMFWTFSWRKGQSLSQYPDLNNAPSDLIAAQNQAVDILRRRTGRMDISVGGVPHIRYSHLVLEDYAGGEMPDPLFVSSADANRTRWARDPLGFDQGLYVPSPSGVGSNAGKRWPYSASFQVPTAFYDKSNLPNRMSQGPTHNTTSSTGLTTLSAWIMADVGFPAHKVHMHDANARHFGVKQPYCVHDQARLPLLFADGAVHVKAAAESNRGWSPNAPSSPNGLSFMYQPEPWEPPTYSGGVSELILDGRFRWTRGLAFGRDFGGPDICTGQPGCP